MGRRPTITDQLFLCTVVRANRVIIAHSFPTAVHAALSLCIAILHGAADSIGGKSVARECNSRLGEGVCLLRASRIISSREKIIGQKLRNRL